MHRHKRRSSDREDVGDRRTRERRRETAWSGSFRFPAWPEQLVQFIVRYLFWALGLIFFNFSSDFHPTWMTLEQLNGVFGLYLVSNTVALVHARFYPDSSIRYRLAMWVDVAFVSLCVLHDPYAIPPSLLVFIMVVLGNGMRYGMRLFGEGLAASFAGAMLALSLRAGAGEGFSPGLIFLNIFGAITIVYAYVLMSRIEASRRKLEQQSAYDPLTGLLNRRALFEAAHSMFDRLGSERSLVVMFADLNKFKLINDTYGHATGDEVLRQFSGILRDCMRSSDVAARFGGDEFVLLLPNTSEDEARVVAERLQAQTSAWAHRADIDVGVTIGMGEAPAHGRDLETLLEKVDQAMYRSKGEPNRIGVID